MTKNGNVEREGERASASPRANTASEILGVIASKRHSKTEEIPPKWRKNYSDLLALRRDLVEQSGRLAREATQETPTYRMHMADSGTDSFDRDFALSLLSSRQDALFEIEQAIKRIETGTYGVCELTGKPISQQRLNAVPWARFSVEAQRQLEHEGAIQRPHLAPLRSLEHVEGADTKEGNG
jgi:RNA polymerase-binding transcription factor DksA